MKKKRAALFRPLIAAAVRGAETLSPAERADVFEGISLIAERFDPVMAGQAEDLSKALRDAEGLQLHFRNLFAEA